MKKRVVLFAVVGSTVLLSGCFTHTALPVDQRPANWGVLINQHHNFYQVSEQLYRSEQPIAEQTAQLQQLGIDTIINLRTQQNPSRELFSQHFQVINIPLYTWAVDRNDVLTVMKQLQQAERQHQKVLIHCYHGADRTGLMVAMYRILFQHWQIDEAVKEMKYGGYGFHPIWFNLEQLFTPENIDWLRQQLAQNQSQYAS